jgi:hypothetical protein
MGMRELATADQQQHVVLTIFVHWAYWDLVVVRNTSQSLPGEATC